MQIEKGQAGGGSKTSYTAAAATLRIGKVPKSISYLTQLSTDHYNMLQRDTKETVENKRHAVTTILKLT